MSVDHLWAPWRLQYIKDQKEINSGLKGCPFCLIGAAEPSEENLCLYRDSEIMVVMNKFPYNPGHLMVLPVGHGGKPEEVDAKVWNRLNAALKASLEVLKKVYNPQGFNLGMNVGSGGGAGIPEHLHWHVVPRWTGDTNFMPILAETKAIPIHNLSVYQELAPEFKNFDKRL